MKVRRTTEIRVESNTAKYMVTLYSHRRLSIYDRTSRETVALYSGPDEILELGQQICQVAETMKQEQKGE